MRQLKLGMHIEHKHICATLFDTACKPTVTSTIMVGNSEVISHIFHADIIFFKSKRKFVDQLVGY